MRVDFYPAPAVTFERETLCNLRVANSIPNADAPSQSSKAAVWSVRDRSERTLIRSQQLGEGSFCQPWWWLHLPSIRRGTVKLLSCGAPGVSLLRTPSGSGWHGIGKMWPEGLRAPPACGCIFGCIVACRVAQFSPNSTTYREAKLLSPHNRDVGLHIFKTGDWHLAISMVRSTRTRFRQIVPSTATRDFGGGARH